VLAGLASPSAGTVRYDGKAQGEYGRNDLARRLAYLEQGGQVHWPLRVDHLVTLGRLPYRRPFAGLSKAGPAAIERGLTDAEVANLRDRSAATLSGGERMRVLLARALAVEAAMLMADEPTAALDPLHQLRIMQLLRSIAERGSGVVVVLHDLSLATRFCDRL